MSKRLVLITSMLGLCLVGVLATKTLFKERTNETQQSKGQAKLTYWTCPMHPQVHQDGPGSCPICHMALVEVSQQSGGDGTSDTNASERSQINPTNYQLSLTSVSHYLVGKQNLQMEIPISGRFASSQSVTFQLYENDLGRIKVGQDLELRSVIAPEEKIKGQISSVDSIIDPTTRTVRVMGSIVPTKQRIFSDATFSGMIKINLGEKLAVPVEAVLHTGTQDLAYLFHQGKGLVPVEVKIGARAGKFYEIIDGIEEGSEIASGPNFLIDSESRIRGAND